ncbi:hypothetical protein SAMN05444411_10137 [Lutibacter oricola]|uniref:Glutamyl-tRNA synthetase n=1 Tax=Lutibacter oricola TaxID=762486 RepID=A0A1H2QM74_9FLAO|nr:DUF4175 family protein [Lutibacter oricola]SDW08231.1 hypothetical protein SAMN05444411_10137 [Lutibacter oricola]
MSYINNIEHKLQKFIKKYYVNELIKGVILFVSIGLLYFILTLLIEYFLWLKPMARTVLFWFFILVEIALLVFYIVIPLFKIFGLKSGISSIEASKIIGNHFPEVNDKLLNMLQLHTSSQNSELLEASIEQKSKQLQPIPFIKAVDFSKNKKYLKYAVLPFIIWMLVYVTGNINIFNDSFSRVVNHTQVYEPPAPFSFVVLNPSLKFVEGEAFTIQVKTEGSIVPENAKIKFLNENYFLENNGLGNFKYTFPGLNESVFIQFEANNVVSKEYKVEVIPTPIITNIKMVLNYPSYTGKRSEIIQNTGNAVVPLGTFVSWQIETDKTEKVDLNTDNEVYTFNKTSINHFNYKKQVHKNLNYTISSSNKELSNHEQLNFNIDVISDEFPKITVHSNIDSISRGPVQFVGQLSDDYKVRKLQLVYYNKNTPSIKKNLNLKIEGSSFTNFDYTFPDQIEIVDGIDYEMYFEVFDNDFVNGSKSTKSKVFSYYKKTEEEVKEELLKEQSESISNISKALEKSKKDNSNLEKFKNQLQKKAEFNWNDTQKLEQFMKRQTQYKNMLQKQTEKLENNLNEQPDIEKLAEKKEDLKKRIEETKKLADQDKLLKELQKLSEKLNKEDLVEKLKEMTKKNKRNEQSLERILELTKRFYVEQKATQIQEKLTELSEKQNELAKSKDEENTSKKQEEINNEFEKIKEDFKELDKNNKDLIRPMKLPKPDDDLKSIDKDLENAMNELNKEENSNSSDGGDDKKSDAKKSQKSAAKKMKEMGSQMGESMEGMEGEEIDENIEDLRKIVENLIEFSFQQEDLLEKFLRGNNQHPEFAKNLKNQHVLKEYFEHIDDSLYALSLRLVKMGDKIQKEVSDVHYNMDGAISSFTENRFDQGSSKQQFVITSANNLANNLSVLLQSLMNASPSFGKGKSGKGQGFSLPDIIKKQGELSEKMKEGMKSGEKGKKGEKGKPKNGKGSEKGEGDINGEDGEMKSAELFEIYKQQAQLKEMLKELLGEQDGKNAKAGSGKAVKQMEELEKEMLEKGFSKEVIEKMQNISYELLKLEEAELKQGKDSKRKANQNNSDFEKRNIEKLKLQKQYFNSTEILNRQSLPLRSIYKKKVQEYFKAKQ